MENNHVRILIADDEPDILDFVSYNLKKEGFEVETAQNGKEAVEKALVHPPDLVILDIMMPEMDGVEVCRKMREQPELANTFIVFLTARTEDYTHVAALEAGGDDFITKPIRPRVLVSRLNAILRRMQRQEDGEDNNTQVFGDLRMDTEKIMVYIKDEQIQLAKKEFELLQLLASRPGKVFHRDEIYHKVWGNDVIVGNRTIDVHVRKLREKIGEDYIKTVKGIGYKFDF